MRPLELTITGFGTYCQRTQINLEQLGSQGLYLITGDTGSGKTTIFDAITYALYGDVNGQNRTVSMIRSTFASPDTPTEVELSFEYRGKTYRVKRNPEYERKSKRGDSVTKQLADATLFLPDGNVITGQSKVTNAIQELLGIDKEQFSQIVMIAQGDFQKLLMEGTETRQEIFRKIFKTDYYRELQQQLLENEKQLGMKRKEIESAISIYVKGLSCDPTSTLNIELEKAKSGELVIADVVELIKKIVQEDEAAQSKLNASITKTENQMNELRDILSKNEKTEEFREEFNQKSDALKKVQETIDEVNQAFEKEKARTKERSDKESELAVLKEELKKYEEVEAIEKDIKNIKEQKETLNNQIKEIKTACEDYKNQETKVTKELESLSDADKEYYEAEAEQKKASDRKSAFDELEASVAECERLLQEYTHLQNVYIEAQKDSDYFDSKYKQMRKIYMDEQAGIIAQELQDGLPCPVCGSLEHPKPAVKSEGAPSKEELDEAEQKDKELEAKASSASLKSATGKTNYENALKLVRESYLKLTKQSNELELSVLKQKIAEQKEEALKQLEVCDNELEQKNTRVERKNQINEQLPKLQEILKQKTETLQSYNEELSALGARLDEKENQAKEFKSKLKFKDIDTANQALTTLENQIEQLKQAFEEAQKKYQEENDKFTALKSQVEQLKDQLEDSKEINTNQIQDELDKLEAERTEANTKKSAVDSRIVSNKKALENINEHSLELGVIQEKYAYVSALSKTANGNLSGGKEKIKLEIFIQMTYFDRIIAHANKRLLIMSDMQYELVRRKQGTDLRLQTGLELDVIDHYNGGTRSVKSLSGGESFQASLALALGLSDEVRLSAGGIKIDSMFVDEGFGTLDSDALQKAFKALSGITEGNRLVGIISHVDLLKEKIDKQIVVKKARTCGSTVEVMV